MTTKRIIAIFTLTFIALIALVLYAATHGSLTISLADLYRGFFVRYDANVAVIYDLRLPRIVISLLGGAALAVSGTLLQAAMKNPLADPGFMGISSAASLAGAVTLMFFPTLYRIVPLFGILGGIVAYLLIYLLVWRDGIQPIRIVLVGVALNMTFIGLAEALRAFTGGQLSQTQSVIAGNVAQKTWQDVHMMVIYVGLSLIAAAFTVRMCNSLELEDKVARAIGINVDRQRFIVALIAVLLAAVTTATMGIIAFVGLIVPHLARVAVGGDHKLLMPYAALLGAAVLLMSDTLGRLIAFPYEISAAVVMSVVGGPCFIIILKLWGRRYAN